MNCVLCEGRYERHVVVCPDCEHEQEDSHENLVLCYESVREIGAGMQLGVCVRRAPLLNYFYRRERVVLCRREAGYLAHSSDKYFTCSCGKIMQ